MTQSDHSQHVKRPAAEESHWLDDPKIVNRIVYGLCAVCALLVLVEPLVHRHAHFEADGIFGFNAWFGFIVFVVIVFSGRALRLLVKRPEDYYDH